MPRCTAASGFVAGSTAGRRYNLDIVSVRAPDASPHQGHTGPIRLLTITVDGAVRTRLLAVALDLLAPALVAGSSHPPSLLRGRGRLVLLGRQRVVFLSGRRSQLLCRSIAGARPFKKRLASDVCFCGSFVLVHCPTIIGRESWLFSHRGSVIMERRRPGVLTKSIGWWWEEGRRFWLCARPRATRFARRSKWS